MHRLIRTGVSTLLFAAVSSYSLPATETRGAAPRIDGAPDDPRIVEVPKSRTCNIVPGEVEFTFADGLVWIDVVVPHRAGPLHFILDTGAGSTVLNLPLARELGLKPGKTVPVLGTRGRTKAYRIDPFHGTLAGVRLPQSILTLDLTSVSQTCHRRIDGILGADFLADRVVQIDFAARRLRIGSACIAPGAEATTLRIKRRNDAWCASVRVNGGPRGWARIDTGFDGALSWSPRGRFLRSGGAQSTAALTARGSAPATRAALDLGSIQLSEVALTFLPRPLFPGESGLLGNGILSNYRLTLDFSANRLVLEPQARDTAAR